MPDFPIFQRIEKTDSEDVKLEKLLDNLLKLVMYAKQTQVSIKCLKK